MASDHTRTAILLAAERLYADRGFGDVTLRDIVAAADVNLAAVNYHFGSKDELIAELFVTRSIATNRERLNELKKAEEVGGGRAEIASILRGLAGVGLYWGLHFALAMAHQTIRDSERLAKLSEGSCDLDDVEAIIERIVAVSAMALSGG